MRLTKEDFLKMSEKLYDKMSVQLDSEKQDFYNYASTLDELLTRYGQELLSESISDGEISERKKKTILTRYGKIKVSEQHSFSDAVHGFRISPYMQERMTYAGQSDVYNERNDLISKFLRIDINFMQVYRVTDKIGELSEGLVGEAESQALVVTAHDVVYAELDVNPIIKKVSDYEVSTKQGKIERQKLLNYLNPKTEILSYPREFVYFRSFLFYLM